MKTGHGVILLILLAGCLGSAKPFNPTTPGPSADDTNPPDFAPTTPLLFFDGPPSMNLSKPTDREPLAAAMHVAPVRYAWQSWEYAFQANATVSHVSAEIWIRVPQTFVLGTSISLSLSRPNATYRLGGDYWSPTVPVLAPGDYKTEFSFDTHETTEDQTFVRDDSLRIHFDVNNVEVSASEPPFYVLYGSLKTPSHLNLTAANEPLD